MAREHAQIKLSLWADDDVRGLTPAAQHLYFVLLTAPTLSYCGVADWRPNRIAGLAKGWTAGQVEVAAAELVESLFILVDSDTEEVLVRSFVRNDGLMKQPKMATAMSSAHAAVSSSALRGVVVHELIRLQKDFPDLKGWGSERAADLLGKVSIDPSTYPLGKGFSKGSVKGKPTPSGKGSPTPAPSPTPTPAPYEVLRTSRADSAPEINGGTVVAAWIDASKANGVQPSSSQIGQVGKLAKELLGKNDPARVLEAAASAGAKGYASIDRELTVLAGNNVRSIPQRPVLRDPRSGIIVER